MAGDQAVARVADPVVLAVVDPVVLAVVVLAVKVAEALAVKVVMDADQADLGAQVGPAVVVADPVVDADQVDLEIPETNRAVDTSRRWLAAHAELRRWSKVDVASRSAPWESSVMVPARWEPVRARLARFPRP